MAFRITATHYYDKDKLQSVSGYCDSAIFTAAYADVNEYLTRMGSAARNIDTINFKRLIEFWDTDNVTGNEHLGFKVDITFYHAINSA